MSFANNCLGCNEKTVLSNFLHHCFPPPGFPPTANCSSLFRKDLFLSSKLQLSVRFFPYSVFNEQSLPHPILADRMRCRRRPIFPCCYRQSIFGSPELNFRVRNGNGWTLRDTVPTFQRPRSLKIEQQRFREPLRRTTEARISPASTFSLERR